MRVTGLLLCLYCATFSANSQPEAPLSPEQWREDIRFVAETIPTAHKNAYHSVSKETLDGELSRLESQVDSLESYEIALELMRIVAMIGDGHTQMRAWDSGMLRQYPIAVYQFADGIHVTAAQAPFEHLEGARLVRIGTGDAEAVWDAVGRYVPGDNEWSRKAWTRLFIPIAELLHVLGFVEDMDAAEWTFETRAGQRVVETFAPIAMDDYFAFVNGVKAPEDCALYRRDSDRNYWLKHFPERDTVYMRFSSVQNAEDKHLAGFSRDLIDFIDDNQAQFLIIDVRENGGGNGNLVRPLIRRIEEHPVINREGHLYMITDRVTFSAAMMFVTRMERATEVIFAGEPAGGKPNHYGDVGEHTLPNSKMMMRLSPLYHEESDPGDERPYQPVDISVPLRAEDFFANRDPVLDKVFEAIDALRD